MAVHLPDTEAPAPQHTLLVVDDQPANIQLMYAALAGEHRVLMATNGPAAVRLCQQHRPDLVLLDIEMPGMDGFEVCQRLKADKLTAGTPVMFVTAHDDPAHEARGLAAGAVDFIAKPINSPVVRARVRTHLALARSSALLSSTLEASIDGILVTDLAGQVSSVNRALLEIWSLDPAWAATATASALFAAMRQKLATALPDDAWPEAFWLTRPESGSETLALQGDRYVERFNAPLLINGVPHGRVLTFRDVTERRRAAEALHRLNASLELRIEERTKALRASTELAQAASRAKSEFLSNMSHEIRTPLHAVIGMTGLALGSENPVQQRSYLEKIRSSGQHLLNLVNDILDFSKIEAGELVLEQTEFTLHSVLEHVVSLHEAAANAKALELSCVVDPALQGQFNGDPLRLTQVVMNYVGNAVKFTDRGHVRVCAEALASDERECLVRVEVSDSGPGLSESQIAQLFQVFHQGDASTTRRYGGTGLGLALCKRLVTLMGGEVGVRSQPGLGSTFWFTCRLPCAAAGCAAPAVAAPLSPMDAVRNVPAGARILVVDDNVLNQEVAVGMLQAVAADVSVAGDGAQALTALERGGYDLVLMDVQMPVMDGLEATRRIRQNPRWADLPVLAMTANARNEDRAQCLQAGMNEFITKPILPERLYPVLARWLPNAPAAPLRQKLPAAADRMTAEDDPVVDLQVLLAMAGGDTTKARRYAQLFVETSSECMEALRQARRQGQCQDLAALGHRMKSSARTVGAHGLARLCESLESSGKAGTAEAAGSLVEQIQALLTRVSSDLAIAMP